MEVEIFPVPGNGYKEHGWFSVLQPNLRAFKMVRFFDLTILPRDLAAAEHEGRRLLPIQSVLGFKQDETFFPGKDATLVIRNTTVFSVLPPKEGVFYREVAVRMREYFLSGLFERSGRAVGKGDG